MLRTARTLVFYPSEKTGLVAHNYLQNKRFACSPDTVKFLQVTWDWRSSEAIAVALNAKNDNALADQLATLVRAGALVARGSSAYEREAAHKEQWQWGVPAALFHTSLFGRPAVSVDESLAAQAEKLEADDTEPGTIFDELRSNGALRIHMRTPLLEGSLQQAIEHRRTRRESGAEPVTLDDLSACLANSVAIQATAKNEAGSDIVFKPTPSGGARAPYDTFVLSRRVDGLDEGVFAYDPFERCLYHAAEEAPDFSAFLNGQDWPANMDALIVLQANFERTMWKYADANAYRVVLIEAGHIGQNIMLAATARGLSACPSGAIDLSVAAESVYNCDPVMRPAIYALGLVRPNAKD